MSFAAGSRVGPYEVVGLLGAGGMGEVFRARDERLGREVALKVLPPSFSGDPGRVRRFEQEARAAGALNHPNVLAVYDVGSHEGVAYLVSELLEGQTLRDRMAGARLPLRKAVDFGVQAARGLAAAHDKGIVHRDLKPENLFVTLDGQVKVLDFGLAKQTAPTRDGDSATEARETEPGTVLGTVGYMSPEQVLGRPADPRSDLFSLGAILFEMLGGRRAFERASPVETMNAILKEEPAPLPPEASVPPALERIARRCLEKGTSERFQSARDLAFALESLSQEEAARVPTPGSFRRGRTLDRAALRLGGAGLVVLLLAVAGGVAARKWLSRDATPALDRYRFTPLATAAGYEGQPSWSPDGRSVAYVAEVDGVLQVHTRSLDSSKSARITRALSDCREPFWSPDGTRIYYTSLAGSSLGLWSVGATGGTPQVVARNARTAAIAPDGQRLVLLREEGQQGAFSLSLWVSSPPGTEPVRYPDPAFAARRFGTGFLRFSPDGRRLGVFVSSTSGDTRGEEGYSSPQLWLLPQPSGTPRQVLPAFSVLPDPAPFGWMPGGTQIVLGAEFPSRTPGTHLWLANTDDGRLSAVTATSGNEESPAVSPDGKQIAFTAGEQDYDLVEIPLAGPALRTVLATSRSEADPAWAPQGGRYAYVTDRTGRQEIWLRTPDGQFDDPLVTSASFPDAGTLLLSGLAFSPDGQRIAYQRRSLSGFRVWISTVAGGRAVRLSADEGYQDSPTWSPDGAWIAFTSLRQGRWSLMRAPTGGGEAPTAIRAGILYPSNPRWSPRGDWILCELPEGVALVSPDGQRTRVLADESWLGQDWSKDGSRVYAVRLSEAQRLQLVEIDAASGAQRTLVADLGPAPASDVPLRGLSLAPDGRSLLTSMYRLRGDLWLLEGF